MRYPPTPCGSGRVNPVRSKLVYRIINRVTIPPYYHPPTVRPGWLFARLTMRGVLWHSIFGPFLDFDFRQVLSWVWKYVGIIFEQMLSNFSTLIPNIVVALFFTDFVYVFGEIPARTLNLWHLQIRWRLLQISAFSALRNVMSCLFPHVVSAFVFDQMFDVFGRWFGCPFEIALASKNTYVLVLSSQCLFFNRLSVNMCPNNDPKIASKNTLLVSRIQAFPQGVSLWTFGLILIPFGRMLVEFECPFPIVLIFLGHSHWTLLSPGAFQREYAFHRSELSPTCTLISAAFQTSPPSCNP